ncbi:MAG TPA: acyl-CoA dehydrogenase family protein [Acidimicrobiales bacterium]|nr:acyl-CoA dehydrogenase family protein [Acidimicrobiales bacterium]
MSIGIGDHHEELMRTVQRWLESRCPPEVPRSFLDEDKETMPPFWADLADQGWLQVHIPEGHGGQGFGFLELAVVLEQMEKALLPGPAVPTALAAALVSAAIGSEAKGGEDLARVLRGLLDGTTVGAVALAGSGTLEGTRQADGSLLVSGTLRPVLGAGLANIVIAPVATGAAWCVIDLDETGASVEPIASLDQTRRVAEVRLDRVKVPSDLQLEISGRLVHDMALVFAAAEGAGGARWCLETANEYAKNRYQFGRPIGQFQAVKHKLADMLVVTEQATAMAWDLAQAADAARNVAFSEPTPEVDELSLCASLAGSVAVDAYVRCAKDCIQILGGMGFTWEHDAHLHLRRALTIRQLVGGTDLLRVATSRSALAGSRRSVGTELPREAEAIRAEIRPLVDQVKSVHGSAERRRLLVEFGMMAPHWPPPGGRNAGALEQLVISEELAAAKLYAPNLAVGAWALPTIIAHGTKEQQDRFVTPSLLGEITWCQLFSEPGAGSDLASLSTRATRVEGGWVLSGQKVWTSMAQRADWGICLARTDPDAPKHSGITYFLVDMKSEGIEVRPLREITGDALFNEVFINDVFVPDECVVGAVNGGWRLARTTLANERVSMASGMTFGTGVETILGWLSGRPERAEDPLLLEYLGMLLAEAHSLALLGERTTLRSVSGVEPGPEASVRKLLSGEHEQRVKEFSLQILGSEGATVEGDAAIMGRAFLSSLCLTIAGGTSEVQRNVIGERLLGLPRDPEPAR